MLNTLFQSIAHEQFRWIRCHDASRQYVKVALFASCGNETKHIVDITGKERRESIVACLGCKATSGALTDIGIYQHNFLACQAKSCSEVTADERLAFARHGAGQHDDTSVLIDERHVETYHTECLCQSIILVTVNNNLGVSNASLTVRNLTQNGNCGILFNVPTSVHSRIEEFLYLEEKEGHDNTDD